MIPDKFTCLLNKVKCKFTAGVDDLKDFRSVKEGAIDWSIGPSISIVPYGLELAGVPPSPLTSKEPKSKKNCFKYYYDDGVLVGSDIYGASGKEIEWEVFQLGEGENFCLRFDDDDRLVRVSGVFYNEGHLDIACRLEEDGEYWCYEYEYERGQAVSMLVYATHSVPGTRIYIEKNSEGLVGLYFYNGSSKIYVYKRK
ncbi:hypothetical protein G7Z99_14745 [Pseudomonas entomophila]|uniref:hypothetical protein n=1 Tax=Pseudomonas entomophila TaxID=312306 RepID=UPI0015E3E80F|nr:hypothetical protein [Pseudomonas entomophila]MBA1190295.1 hypothetical protein [Pseudomonas entomophila]